TEAPSRPQPARAFSHDRLYKNRRLWNICSALACSVEVKILRRRSYMINRLTILVIQAFTLVLLISINALAQDRAALEKEIGALREQLKQKEAEFLAPSAGDRATF